MSETVKPSLISNELKLRIISAIILAAIVLLITWIGGQTFKLLWAIAAIAVLVEFTRITKSSLPAMQRLFAFAFLGLIIVAWLLQSYQSALIIFLLGFIGLFIWEWIGNKSAWSSAGFAYAVLPFFAVTALRGDESEGLIVILVLFACVWGADVFAYFFGKSIGGPKLAPKISPKKTWAGFIGSLIGALLLSWLVIDFSGYSVGGSFFVMILVLAVSSQIGDLVESVIKRKFDVKDSGTIIPGHGGVLDRIDGLIFSGVVLWFWLMIVQGFPSLYYGHGARFFDAFILPL